MKLILIITTLWLLSTIITISILLRGLNYFSEKYGVNISNSTIERGILILLFIFFTIRCYIKR